MESESMMTLYCPLSSGLSTTPIFKSSASASFTISLSMESSFLISSTLMLFLSLAYCPTFLIRLSRFASAWTSWFPDFSFLRNLSNTPSALSSVSSKNLSMLFTDIVSDFNLLMSRLTLGEASLWKSTSTLPSLPMSGMTEYNIPYFLASFCTFERSCLSNSSTCRSPPRIKSCFMEVFPMLFSKFSIP